MKKMLLLLVAAFVQHTLVTAQENLAVLTKQETEKSTVLKNSLPAQPFVWKENGTGINNNYIAFSKEFTQALNGKQPFILVSPVSNNQGFYISDISDKGFTVKKGQSIETDQELRFNWQAEIPNMPQR